MFVALGEDYVRVLGGSCHVQCAELPSYSGDFVYLFTLPSFVIVYFFFG